MAATKAADEDGEKYANNKSATPAWGADARIGDHLWIRYSSSGDSCYVGSNGCTKSQLFQLLTAADQPASVTQFASIKVQPERPPSDVPKPNQKIDKGFMCEAHGQKKRRIKCASCKICVHTDCLRTLMGSMQVFCRKTFQDAENGNYRENTDVPHHWVAKKAVKGRCRTCGKSCGGKVRNMLNSCGGKVCNLSHEYSMSCSWCKEVCHNRDTCFDANKFSTESCNLGAHSNLIVPSTWIVKLPEEEAENTKTVFVVKPIPTTKSTPLLVFINPKSGGNQGSKLMRTFQWLLNPRQVFDLTEGGPGLGLELYKRVPNLRILACGGDGTVGWVLSILDKLKLCHSPPVAVLPLGTGNDLARALGWGGGYTDEPIPRILTNIQGGEIVRLDRWILKVTPNDDASDNSSKEHARKDLPLCVVNNYFSLGVDAHVALEFHEAREANPQKFNSRIRNKMFYGQCGGKDLIQRKWKDLSNFVTLECDGKDVTAKLKELRVHAILFLNICSYGGGTRPWGGSNQFQPPSTEDGLIEVIGLTTYQLPLLQAGGHGSSIAQCRKAKLITKCTIPVQVDGEPCRLMPSIVEMDLLNTVNMIARAKNRGLPVKKENVDITLPLKLIPLSKYESEHQRKSALKDRAVDFGTITVAYNKEIKDIRSKVGKILEEKTKDNTAKDKSGRRCSKVAGWWFLDSCSGGKFYRIDEAQEHLFYVNDICDEDLYIAGETGSYDQRNDLRAGREDDVSRLSTSSSGRQSLEESGEDRGQEEGEEGEYDEGEEGEYEEGEYEEGEYEEGEYEEGEYEEGEYEEGEYEEGEYEEGEDGEEYDPEADYEYDDDDGTTPVAPTQIVIQSASDVRSLDQGDIDDLHMENAKDLLSLPEKRPSLNSLKIDESEMDLITAAKLGNLNRVAELHNAGVSLAEKDHEGRTALHHAAFIGNLEVVRYLAAYAPIGILDARDDMMFQTALHRAALRGDRKVCSILVSSGASLDIRDKQGCTAQELAEAIGDKNLAQYLETMATPVIL